MPHNQGTGQAVPSETDIHYGYVALGSFVTSAADLLTPTQISKDIIDPKIQLNAFGKDKHGMLCWDVKEFIVEPPNTGINSEGADQDLQQEWQISGDNSRTGVAPTARIDPNNDDYVASGRQIYLSEDDTDGTMTRFIRNVLDRYPFDNQMIDGNSFGQLLTAGHYWFSIDTNNLGAVATFTLGMRARLVIVPLTEAFFDQRDVSELLFAAQVLVASGV